MKRSAKKYEKMSLKQLKKELEDLDRRGSEVIDNMVDYVGGEVTLGEAMVGTDIDSLEVQEVVRDRKLVKDLIALKEKEVSSSKSEGGKKKVRKPK